MLFGFGQTARADLTLTGPTDLVTGFPTFYQDIPLVQLSLCDVLPADGLSPPCPSLTLTNPAGPVDAANIVEAFYYVAAADSALGGFDGPNGEILVITAQVLAAGAVAPDPAAVINEVTIRLDNLTIPGDYTVATPWGTFGPFTVPNPIPVGFRIDFRTSDDGITGVGEAPAFGGALGGPIQHFLGNGTGAAFPGHIGDGVTAAALIIPPGFPGPSSVTVSGAIDATTNLFLVEGKVAAFGLNVTLAGNGTGTVTSAPVGINCPGDCTEAYAPGTVVTLTATPTVGIFTTWTGCTPVPGVPTQCTATMNAATNVTATFSAASIAVAPLTGAFGDVNLGSVEMMNFTVTNNSVVNVLMGTAAVAGTLTTDFTKGTDTCSGQTLLPAGTCIIQVRFLPTAAAAMAGTLTIPSNAPGAAPVIPLSGTGTNAQVFGDILPTSPFENHINSLSNNGIALGCTVNQFCPQNLVTRGQMSAFIIRADEGEPATTIITVPMSGAQEIPVVTTAATGTASMTVNLTTGVLGGSISFSNLTAGGITLAHIHEAALGVNGPPIVDFTGGFTPGQTTGTVTISGTLTPAQITTLIARGLYFNIHSVAFPNGEIRGQIEPRFTDVPFNDTFFRHIERMAIRGITLGIGGNLYGPVNNVTRAAMASFIVRAVDGADATTCLGTVFTDVPVGAPHCANIERLRTLNVTLGCGTNLYCPADSVPREQMAAFIARAFLGIP